MLFITVAFFAFLGGATVYAAQGQCEQAHTAGSEDELNAAITAFNGESGGCNHSIALTADITLTADLTQIKNSTSNIGLTINGNNHTIDGVDAHEVIDINKNTVVNIDSLSVTRSSNHGIVNNKGIMTLTNSIVTFSDEDGILSIGAATIHNTIVRDNGESISINRATGIVTISNSLVENNQDSGLHIFGDTSVVNIINSTIRNNDGSGIESLYSTVTVRNSTINGNSEDGLHNEGTMAVGNSTISSPNGRGVYQGSGEMTLINSTVNDSGTGVNIVNGILNMANSIVANSVSNDCVQSGGMLTVTHTLIENPEASCNNALASGASNVTGQDPLLAELADNGGLTQTYALVDNSPAVNVGDNVACQMTPIDNVDQRGVARPQGFVCDMGAYEFEQGPSLTGCANVASFSGDFTVQVETEADLDGWIACHNKALDGTQTLNVVQDLTLTEALTVVNNAQSAVLVINGNGYALDGASDYRHFDVNDGSVAINNITLQNGASYQAGSLLIGENAVVTLTESMLNSNQATHGGAIYNNGVLIIDGSTLAYNQASNTGGGIYNRGPLLQISNSTFSGNSAKYGGTISHFINMLKIDNSTFANNLATNRGGHLNKLFTGEVEVRNTIFSNSPVGTDCYGNGEWNVDNSNLDSDGSCDNAVPSETINLGPLQNNGGTTMTHALLAESSAIDAGNDAFCQEAPVNNVDQRGVSREQGEACDIGAYEFQMSDLGGTAVSLANSASTASTLPLVGTLGGILLLGIAGVVIRQRNV